MQILKLRKQLFSCSAIACLLSASTALASPGRVFEFTATPWAASCDAQNGCGIPVAIGSTQTLKLFVANPSNPGEAKQTAQDLSLQLNAGQDPAALIAKIQLVAAFPPTALHLPKYDNLQLDLLSPVHATCAMSPRANWGQLPPLVCASDSVPSEGKFTRTGITLISKSILKQNSL